VTENLRLERYTPFDADTAVVDGQPFEEFLVRTTEYRFVSWLVEELLYEIRDTGNQKALGDLYTAVPHVDRAEFRGSVTADEESYTFDIVLRDRKERAIAVVDIHESADTTSSDELGELVTAASEVASASGLASAFQVTTSFFDRDALETAEKATKTGLLTREKRRSYVNLSNGGYHLCLVESREGTFHLSVPEL